MTKELLNKEDGSNLLYNVGTSAFSIRYNIIFLINSLSL